MLIDRYWGSYLAILPNGGRSLDIVRAPLGDLGACVASDAHGWLIGSDAAIIAQVLSVRPSIDRDAMARHLALPELVTGETCLSGISEIRGGDCLTLDACGGSRTNSYWSPWTFANRASGTTDATDATRRVRDAVTTAVAASSASYPKVLLFLSGGLDSSIVASCLTQAAQPLSCLNLVTRDLVGDERHYARVVAAMLEVTLAEVERTPSGIDFTRSLGAMLPRPMARAFNQESERLALIEATRIGATALIDGSGGDNLFCSHRSVAATADCLLAGGLGSTYNDTARALNDLTGASLPLILFQSIRRAWFRPAQLRSQRDVVFLAEPYVRTALDRPDHPWLVPPPGMPPGRAVHVSLLAAAQSLVESGSAAMAIDRVSPLMTQIVAEACLQVPSWMWFAPGHDRAVARRAFAADLPRAIIDRRTKGTPAPFVAEILASRREQLKPFLLDGVLGSAGILDRDALRHHFDDPTPARGPTFARILALIDAEAWARCWI